MKEFIPPHLMKSTEMFPKHWNQIKYLHSLNPETNPSKNKYVYRYKLESENSFSK